MLTVHEFTVTWLISLAKPSNLYAFLCLAKDSNVYPYIVQSNGGNSRENRRAREIFKHTEWYRRKTTLNLRHKFSWWNGRCERALSLVPPNCSTGIEYVLHVKKCFFFSLFLVWKTVDACFQHHFHPCTLAIGYIISCMSMWKMSERYALLQRILRANCIHRIAYCLW